MSIPYTKNERILAQHSYGYGNWAADYWFIGFEQGLPKQKETEIKITPEDYFAAFEKLQTHGLCDCKEFHSALKQSNWHKSPKPNLQQNWQWLIVLLLAYKQGKPLRKTEDDKNKIRTYQCADWGKTNGETCVIDLHGVPSNKAVDNEERDSYKRKRVAYILERMKEKTPKFVIIYGNNHHDVWREAFGTLDAKLRPHVAYVRLPSARHRGVDKYAFWSNIGINLLKDLSISC